MDKPKNMESWGRSTARKRYAEGGDVEVSAEEAVPSDRAAEVDEFISQVMRDQIKKMED